MIVPLAFLTWTDTALHWGEETLRNTQGETLVKGERSGLNPVGVICLFLSQGTFSILLCMDPISVFSFTKSAYKKQT